MLVLAVGLAAGIAATQKRGPARRLALAPRAARVAPAPSPAPLRARSEIRSTPRALHALVVSAAAEQHALSRFLELGLPLYCGGERGRYAALTFDDGPSPLTPLLLRLLRRYHAQATFFLVGRNVARFATVVSAQRRLAALGDHTWTHAPLTALSPTAAESELARTQREIERDGGADVALFRPPYGARDRAVDEEAHTQGLLDVMWSLDSKDWTGLSPRRIVRLVGPNVRRGSIVLMHDWHRTTLAALGRLVPELEARGFKLVSVPELLALDPPTPTQLRGGFSACFPLQGHSAKGPRSGA